MLKILLLPEALKDLEVIYEHTFLGWGLLQAEKYQDELNDALNSISEHPEIGIEYRYKQGGYRKYNCNKHLIFYRVEASKLLIIRILHEKIDLNSNWDI